MNPDFSTGTIKVTVLMDPKKKRPEVKLEGAMLTQSLDMVTGRQTEWKPNLWCDGAVHEFQTAYSIAGYNLLPDVDSRLTFKVELSKGYVFIGGKGKVKTPKGGVVELDPSKTGYVLGNPAEGK